MFDAGYLRLGRIKGVPIKLHWSVLLLFVMVGGGLRFAPGAWLGGLVLILIHEAGHALLARRYRFPVYAIEVHGLGGLCRYGGHPTAWERSVIAWGGVLGQAVLFAVALGLTLSGVLPRTRFLSELLYVCLSVNAFIAALNLLPFPGLDGAEAWKLPRLWASRRAEGRARRARKEKKAAKKQAKEAAAARKDRLAQEGGSGVRLVRQGDDFKLVFDESETEKN